MKYRILIASGIELVRHALLAREPMPDVTAHEVWVGAGEPLDESVLTSLANRIEKTASELAKARKPSEDLDRLCFDDVHKTIPRDPLLCADFGFWTRFAAIHLREVIQKRFPGKKGTINLDNFGLGKRKECWPYKLWVRGQVSCDPSAKDPYALGRVGGVDIWTSHVHRQNFMTVPQVFKTVIQYQYPPALRGRPFLYEGEENPDKGGFPGIRTLVKRLKENWASVEYVLLKDREVLDLVRLHSKGLRKPDGTLALRK